LQDKKYSGLPMTGFVCVGCGDKFPFFVCLEGLADRTIGKQVHGDISLIEGRKGLGTDVPGNDRLGAGLSYILGCLDARTLWDVQILVIGGVLHGFSFQIVYQKSLGATESRVDYAIQGIPLGTDCDFHAISLFEVVGVFIPVGHVVLSCTAEFASPSLSLSPSSTLSLASRHGQVFESVVAPGSEYGIDFSANPGNDIDIATADQVVGAS